MRNLEKVFLLCALFLFAQCTGDSGNSDEGIDIKSAEAAVDTEPQVEISPQMIEDVINAIPSPLELSSMIKESGAEYAEEMLNPTENKEKYLTNKKKAVNLGIYGADLGYVNLYDQTTSSVGYLETIKDLSDDLKIGHFFDFTTLRRLASNSSNMDSLLYISLSSMEKMNQYLREQNRADLSVLIVTGGWIEATYIACQVHKEGQSQGLAERIGEQKITLDELIILLTVYKTDAYFAPLLKEFEDLKEIYSGVEIEYIYKEPITKEVNGMLVIEDQTEMILKITPEQIKTITDKIESIRSKLIN